jgi:tetratricopeptide (TPR) repeat protein
MKTVLPRRLAYIALGVIAVVGIVLLAGAAIFRPTPARVLSAARVEPTVVANDPATKLLQRGDSAFENGDYAAAVTAYSAALTLNPNFAEAYNDRGIAYYRRGELERAIADYERALALRPDYVNALTNHAVAIFDRAAYDTVITETSRAIALDPADDLAFVYRGNAHQRKGDYASALGDWLSARAIRAERQAGGY